MKYRAVIFDLFGTLIDNFSRWEYREVLTEMAEVLGAPAEAFVRVWGQTAERRMVGEFPSVEAGIRHVSEIVGTASDDTRLRAAAQIRIAFTRENLLPRDGALSTLRKLRDRRCRTGLITDCTLEVPLLWEATAFAPLVDAPVFSCVARLKKPDPRIYELACERLKLSPEECLYVGDGSSGELTGSARVGMHPVLINVPYDDPQEWERAEVEEWQGTTISELTEVLRLVE